MKKIALTILIALASFTLTMGQANSSGNININVGLGFSPSYIAEDQTLESAPIHFNADYSIFSFLSAGISWGLSGASKDSNFQGIPASLVTAYNTFSLRGSAHLPLLDNIDIYAGGSVGIQRAVDTFREIADGSQPLPNDLESVKNSSLHPAAHIGVRVRLLGNIGVYAEGGYGLSLVQVGLNMKL